MELAVILHSGTASGKRVDVHMMVSKYLFPVYVLGSGPTQSTVTHSNGSPRVGIGHKGISGMTLFAH